jgi:hypothetical protein
VMFFKGGVFLRAQGAVKAVAKDLSFDRAVVYAVWKRHSPRRDRCLPCPIAARRGTTLAAHAGGRGLGAD